MDSSASRMNSEFKSVGWAEQAKPNDSVRVVGHRCAFAQPMLAAEYEHRVDEATSCGRKK